MSKLTPAIVVARVDNTTGQPATNLFLEVLNGAGQVVASKVVPATADASFAPFDYVLPAGSYSARVQTLNAAGNRIGDLVTTTFEVVPMVAYVPTSLSISVA